MASHGTLVIWSPKVFNVASIESVKTVAVRVIPKRDDVSSSHEVP